MQPFRTKERLEHGARVLDALDYQRIARDNPNIGYFAERLIVERELRDLEKQAAIERLLEG